MPMSKLTRSAMLLLAAAAVAACDREPPLAPQSALPLGYWQAAIELPGGTVETAIEIGRKGEGYKATLLNGQERIAIGRVSVAEDGELLLRFPAFDSEIRAEKIENRLVGTLTVLRPRGERESMPFTAEPGRPPLDAESPKAEAHDMSGRWLVQFHNPDGSTDSAVGEFAQRGTRLFGTFLHPFGDSRFLSGYLRGDRFKLSGFDGAEAMIFSGRVGKDGIRDADYWNGTYWHQKWSAVRNPDTPLPGAVAMTHVSRDGQDLDFRFPDTDGKLVSLSDERFAGRVVALFLGGSWNPHSHDLARLLAPMHRNLEKKGLDVIALMYEHHEDEARAMQQIREFRDKFDIRFETLLAGTSDLESASASMPALNEVNTFPTLLLIDRRGAVRRIYTGFFGPAAGRLHTRLQKEIETLVNKLLAESPDDGPMQAATGANSE